MSDKNLNVDFKKFDGLYGILVIVAFLFGIVVTYSYYQNTSNELSLTQIQLRKAEINNLLMNSIIETKGDDYNVAIKNASSFYNEIQIEKDKGNDGILYGVNSAKLKFILDKREETIRALENQDKSSLDNLKAIHSVYIKSIGKKLD